ncbi:MAG: hypothetical protein QOJ21_2149 [Solirubrobacteraceae bacterium]|jgi:hypothetical protein|nr:hypothetical protein [Solirubrobacteraceae bacterium]
MHRRISKGMGLAAVAAVCLMSPAAALAADATSTGTVTGGTLSLSTTAAPTFSATLDGANKTPTYTVPFTLNDARGTGVGWNTTITSTQFKDATTSKTLPADASSITGVISAVAGGTATDPVNGVDYTNGVGIPAGATAPTDPIKFFNAGVDSGMGKFTVTPTVAVSVPANSYAGTYSSTVTLADVSGP